MKRFRSGLKKVFFLFIFSVLLSLTDTHTLQFFYTGVTPGSHLPEFTAVSLVDGEQSEYYDSSIGRAIPKTEWIKKVDADDPHYWSDETESWQEEQEWLKHDVGMLVQRFNQSTGVHMVQVMFGCELEDDGTTRAYSQWGYDGEDFISLDLETETWRAATLKAVIAETKWSPTGHNAYYCTYYLKNKCIDSLKMLLSYGNKTLMRKVPPEASVFHTHSPSPPELVCHATGFFPKAVMIYWQKDGEDVQEDVELRETLPNQDGSFQKRSVLKVPAEELQKQNYTCIIQHSSLEKEKVLQVPKGGGTGGGSGGGSGGGMVTLLIGVVAALAVLIAVITGIIIWRKKNSGFRPVPQNTSPAGGGHYSYSAEGSGRVSVCLPPAELRE